ncbi:filamentous hemagglutinin N-terminal domain-containing protein [Azovibrio restrictus]|uniref:two-partner secretion domain-containing protein n=1 Tax=Azovibrio restrictus TaxID=146938 RepID=UPI0026EFFA61|nr:filamentous hemagglutinin N-terminal domain-containing protein [Azovibrio restrictus]
MNPAGLNHTYRLIWSDIHQAFVAVAEFARARGKRASKAVFAAACIAVLAGPTTRRRQSAILSLLSTLWLGAACGATFAANLPEGGQIVAGAGSIAQSGNTMTVTQSTDRMAANWQSFSIGQGYAVNFVQPSSSAIALNRVLGSDVSRIQGSLTANGQVFLVNPNGVLFTPTARVEVGGLIASTRDLSVQDFMAGHYRFSGSGNAAIRNEGEIKVGAGGTAAFIAARIENAGRIEAPQGNVLMAAADTVRLDLGGPVKLEVEKGALDALIEQGGAILADGGRVLLTAQAADELAAAVINHTGITEARTLATGERGEILLLADMKTGQVNVGGRLDASAPAGGDGGFIETSAARVKVADDARITTHAAQGATGTWLIDPNDYTIAASGGDITGATLSANLASNNVTIQSAHGATSGNGDIFVRDNVTWTSGNTLTLSAYRNIEILATLDASGGSGGKVALEVGQGAPAAGNTASYSFGLTSSGFTGKINLQAGPNFTTKLGSDGGTITYTVITSLGSEGDETSGPANSLQGLAHASNFSGNFVLGTDIDASATNGWIGGAGFVPLHDGLSSSYTGRFDGLGHTVSNLTIYRPGSDYVGLFGSLQTGASIANLGVVNASVTGRAGTGILAGSINGGTVLNSYATGSVTGSVVGLGGLVGYAGLSTVSGSHANTIVSGAAEVGGLIGAVVGSSVRDSFTTGSVTGSGNYVGGLIGRSVSGGGSDPLIERTWSTATVQGRQLVGGLIGEGAGSTTVRQSFATGHVTATFGGNDAAGGLVGQLTWGSLVEDSYATGNVSGQNFVGGLVGVNNSGATIRRSYATGNLLGTTGSAVGGLVGGNWGTIQNSFHTGPDNGLGTFFTTDDMKRLSAFGDSFWDIDDEGGTGTVWRIYDRLSYPLLRWALTPLTVTANSGTRVYDGTTDGLGVSYSTTTNPNLLGTATVTADDKDAGNRTLSASGHYSTSQWGYDIAYVDGSLTITPRPVVVRADAKSKTEGQPDPALTYSTGCAAGQTTDCGLVTGESLTGSLTRDAGEAVGAYAIRQGTLTDASNPNYAISYVGANLTIAAASSGGGSTGGVPLDAALASVRTTAGKGGGNSGFGERDGMLARFSGLFDIAGNIRLPANVLVIGEEETRK